MQIGLHPDQKVLLSLCLLVRAALNALTENDLLPDEENLDLGIVSQHCQTSDCYFEDMAVSC
jgi:hypothetical protein